MFLPLGEFTPDMPDYNNPGSSLIQNVYPKTAQSYGSITSLSTYATALPLRVQGGIPVIDTGANTFVFAGTATDLYKIGSGATTFTNVSQSAGTYSTATNAQWSMCQFGNQIIATNYNQNPQVYTLGSSTTFTDLTSAFKAQYVTIVKDFVMFGNTYDGAGSNQPQQVWWSAINNASSYPTIGSITAAQVQSDQQVIPGNQGWMTGLVGNLGTADVAIFFERSIWRGTYVGSPNIFAFSAAEGARGTNAPGSIVQVGAQVYYLGEDGFYAFDGSNSSPIGANKVDKWFYKNINLNYLHNISGAADPVNKIIFWAYPSNSSTTGQNDSLIIYNWSLNRWSIASVNSDYIFRAFTFGYTLEGLDALGYTLDTLPFSLDDRAWTGGKVYLAGFDTNHAFGYFTGQTLAATVQTSEVELAAQEPNPSVIGRRALVTNARPIVDGGTPTVSIGYRQKQQDSIVYSTGSTINAYGECPQRLEARYFRAQITHPAGDVFDHISGVDLTYVMRGTR